MSQTDPNTFGEMIEVSAADTVATLERIIRESLADEVTVVDDEVYTVVTPAGMSRHLIDLQTLASAPARPRGTVTVHTPTSFAQVVDAHTTEDTRVYVNTPAARLVAVVNDDRADGTAGWRDRRVELVLQPTPEWTFWTKHQGLGEQQKFAETIEDGLSEITNPAAADMLELAQSFEASISSKFVQRGRLTDGRMQFAYSEDIDAKAGENGTLTIPAEFTVRLAVYVDSPPVDLCARLRYRLTGGKLTIGYQLVHPERAQVDAFDNAVSVALAGLSDPFVVHGAAPDPAQVIAPTVTSVRG